MTPERWQRVKSAMTCVLQAPTHERGRVLDEQCGDDDSLRAEVESLLAEVRPEDAISGATGDSLRALVLDEARALANARSAADVETLRARLQQNLGATHDIVSTLGVGGMGAVFLAREHALDRYVAIKTLRAEQAMTVASRERFRREARIAAGLSHPGILPLYSFGETGGTWYLVMGYVRGQSLAQRLHAEGRLAPDEALRILRALADALAHAHGRQIIHRDIKPSNILLDAETAQPLLADFGISKVIGDNDPLTRTGDILGTPHFMSPEQMTSAQECTVQSDVYALGAVAYVMLTGRVPLPATASGDLFTRRATSDIIPLLQFSPSVSAEFSSIVMRCLATRAHDRWPSAVALRDALDRLGHSADSTVPTTAQELSGFGAFALVWFGLWMATLSLVDSTPRRALVVLVALLVPLGLTLHVGRASSPSQRQSQLWRVAFWPPLWWGMWWPSFLRRPTDVWKRLPWPARMIRVLMSVLVVALPLLAFGTDQRLLDMMTVRDRTGLGSASGVLLSVTLSALICAFLWANRLRLSRIDTLHFLLGPTARSDYWKRGEIDRLLEGEALGVRAPTSGMPADYLRALRDLQRITATRHAPMVESAITFGQMALAVLTQLDHDIAAVDRDAPPAELARLDARLAVLRESTPNGTHADTHHALTAIVESERAMLRNLQQRKLLAQNKRAALMAVLASLFTELTQGAESSASGGDTATRLAALLHSGHDLLGEHVAP